ncbi:SgcJ/EcaC family oxidoreductase [Sphingobium sp. SYK-6]|uniref:SgcJ/EcaC family oxidoreductase n=1 Tax=Sphingobium sp. (strain NBRC 103272 / SYK-6) TaxID=627192 RepID=UPI000A04A862|nr:SgcJ/EcaC family oxidoreductase [Sphingobium sp. SYK-6]
MSALSEPSGHPRMTRRELAALPVGVGLLMSSSKSIAAQAGQKAGEAAVNRIPLDDRKAIEDLFSTYVWAYDCSDEAGFLELFTEDGLVVGLGKKHVGKEAMGAWFRYLLDIREREGDLWLHQAAHHRYVGSGSNYLVYSYATHYNYAVEAKTYGVRSLGYFVSECVKQGTEWKFRRFSISHWDKTTQPWKKSLPWDTAAI